MKKIFILAFCCAASLHTASQTKWQIDATKSNIEFTIDGPLGIDVDGTLGSPKGIIVFDASKLEGSSFNISMYPNTIFTDNRKRDEHLKKSEFFDVSKYKVITFVSTRIQKDGDKLILTGSLSMKDKTLVVKIPFTFTKSESVGHWKGEFKLNRLDYHVGTSSLMMGDDVKILIEVYALESAAAK